jgi:hypothetical protein
MRISLINNYETVCMEFAEMFPIFGMFITNSCNNVLPVRLLCACNSQSNAEPMLVKVYVYL